MKRTETATAQPEPSLDVQIGANIHTLMWRAKETQATLAPIWGMSQAALSLKLRGKRPWFASEIDAAARHYGVSRDALFGAVGLVGFDPTTFTVEDGRLAEVIPLHAA